MIARGSLFFIIGINYVGYVLFERYSMFSCMELDVQLQSLLSVLIKDLYLKKKRKDEKKVINNATYHLSILYFHL